MHRDQPGVRHRDHMVNFHDLQESTYHQAYDYRLGSPHLSHPKLADQLTTLLRGVLRETMEEGQSGRVLEVGAGEGSYTEPILASGYEVVATEVSRPSIARLVERFGGNPRFSAVYDRDGSLEVLSGERFSAIICVSVLHHIPDYVSFAMNASRLLVPGGTFITLQDPLWYPSLDPFTYRFSKMAYYSWRLTRGHYLRGIQTLMRRFRGVYRDDKPGDVVEYHVVRQGIDQDSLTGALQAHFRTVELFTYWSTQSSVLQTLGEKLGLKNTFALIAKGATNSNVNGTG